MRSDCDPDSLLLVNLALLPRATLGRAAVEALFVMLRAWPSASVLLVREDVVSASVLPLLQTRTHPRLVASMLQFLRLFFPRAPLYHAALSRHGLFQAILLTAETPRSSAASSQAQAAQ